MWYQRVKKVIDRKLHYSAFNIFMVGAITLSSVGVGLLIDAYNKHQARTPHALAETTPASAPAADATLPTGKASALPISVQQQLDADRKAQQDGHPSDRRHVQALNEGRTENDTVFLNADGSKSLRRSLVATSYRENGQWKDVDVSLAQDATDGKWKTKANSWQARFGAVSPTQGVELNQGGQTVTFKPLGASQVQPEVTGTAPNQIVKYRNVWPGIDLMYQLSGSEVKESIVIKSRAAASTFSFDFSGANLLPDTDNPGGFKLDGALSNIKLPVPTIATATEGILGAAPIVRQSVNGSRLTVTLDSDWMQKQTTDKFPLVIDPSFWSYSGSNYVNYKSDGYVCNPGQGCGNSVGNVSGNIWRFMFYSPYSSVAGKYIVQAIFHVEMPTPDGVHYYGTYDNRSVYLDHAGCFGYGCIDYAYGEQSGTVGSTGDIDVSDMYRRAAAAGDYSAWMIVHGEEANTNSYKLLAYDRTLVWFDYESLPSQSLIAAGSPADQGITTTNQPLLKTTASTDPDGPGPLQYRYIIGTSKTVPGSNPYNTIQSVSGVVADSGLTPISQWTVPDNVLQDGTTYYWQSLVWDSYQGTYLKSASVYSPTYSFKVDMRNGKDATQAFDTVGPVSVDLATGNLTTGAKSHSIAALGGSLGIGLDYNSPQRSRQGLVAQYWNNTTFSGNPVLTRVEPNVDYNWNTGSPYTGMVTTDNFSARWSGYFVAPYTTTYTMGCVGDDTVKVTLNSQVVLDTTSGGCYTNQHWGTGVALTAGQAVPITVDYTEATGAAYNSLWVRGVGFSDQVVPTEWLQTGVRPVATPHGLIGRYYTGSSFPSSESDVSSRFLARTDTTLGMDWGAGSPVPNGPADNFVVRWSGYFKAPQDGTYKFGGQADDGIKIIVDGVTQLDNWSTSTTSPAWPTTAPGSTGVTMTAGQTKSITVEYREVTGNASLGLYVDGPGIDKTLPVPSDWLLPQAQVLPDGWGLSIDADGDLGYDFATIGVNSVVLRDSTGETHEYKWTGSGYTPPVNETGHMVRNGDGTITLQDSDGRTYVFDTDGTLKLSTSPADDRNPAALQYSYSGLPAHLTQVTDGVDSSRWAKVYYSGDAGCPSVPSGFSAVPAGMICAVTTSDSQVTQFAYSSTGRLARLIHPGSEISDYGFDSLGRITSMRDSLANDAISAGVRTQDGNELTTISYDAIGRVSSITMPAATAGAAHQSHSYSYYSAAGSDAGYTIMHPDTAVTGGRKVTYDTTYRTLTDTEQYGFNWNGTIPITGDFNGDGKADVALLNNGASGASGSEVMFAASTGSGYQPLVRWANLPGWSWDGIKPLVGDFNGDGKADLALVRQATGDGADVYALYGTSSPSNNSPTLLRNMPSSSGWAWSKFKLVPGDINGDGKADLTIFHQLSDDGVGIHALYGGSTPFGNSSTWVVNLPASNGWAWSKMKLAGGKFNADGYSDVAIFHQVASDGIDVHMLNGGTTPFANTSTYIRSLPAANGWVWSKVNLAAGNFNGDAYDDVALVHSTPSGTDLHTLYGASSPLANSTTYVQSLAGWNWFGMKPFTGDANADGKADFGSFNNGTAGAGGDQIMAGISTGTTFGTPSSWLSGLTTKTEWDVDPTTGAPRKDMVLSSTDAAGLKSTTIYDEDDRPTDQYGPAPSSWYGTDRKPLTANVSSTPHTQTGYDEGITGLAATYYDVAIATNGTGVSTKVLTGAPRSHQTGVGPTNGDVVKNWGSTQPITPSQSTYGWGLRLSGSIKLAETGDHTFKVKSDDGARLWIDDILVADDWADGVYRDHTVGVFTNPTANSWHRVRLDYYNKAVGSTLDADGHLELFKTAPGGSETSVLGSILTPRYGLATSQKTFDSSAAVGDTQSTTNYGANPELGLAQSNTLDSAGLNYTSSSTYEAQGTSGSYLRQLTKVLPGNDAGNPSTQYAYYGATETRANPCVGGAAVSQAGMLKLKAEADPDGAGAQISRTTETVYDAAGRVVATRYNSDSWTCTTYDSRGRVTQVAIPAFGSAPARTVTNNWSVGGNPFVVSTADANGTITSTSDLLGRTVSYTDANNQTTTTSYDSLGRLSSRSGPLGAEGFTYDSYNRLTTQTLDGVTQAVPSYDGYGRLSGVTYPTAGSQALAISRDSLGRTVGMDYTLGNGTTHVTDAVTRSQSGQIISGTELGQSKSYTYDKAGRLTSATIGSNTYSYGFGSPTSCTGTYNANANKNSNRTSQTVNGVTTTYCYDYADRLVSSSDASVTSPVYDAHGNTTQIGTTPVTQFAYDSSDRNSSITVGSKSATYTRDVQGRTIQRVLVNGSTTTNKYGFTGAGDSPDLLLDASNAIVEKYEQLPGGVLLTVRPNQTAPANRVFSLVNVHGDTMATTDANGTQTGTFMYDPFGNPVASSPNNTATGSTYGWVGQHEKDTETAFALAPTEMGARVYLAKIGRFLQVDPQEGGNENGYVYPTDPVNGFDLDGNAGFWDKFKAAAKVVTTVATIGSFIPGPIGIACSAVAVAGNVAQGRYGEALVAAGGLVGAGLLTKVAAKAVNAGRAGMFLKGVEAVSTKLARVQSRMPVIGVNSKLFGHATLGSGAGKLNNYGSFKLGWSRFPGNRQTFRAGWKWRGKDRHWDFIVGGRW